MKIKQVIIDNNLVFIFTDNPRYDIEELEKAYESEKDFEFPLGYEIPELSRYTFLGKQYECISLWFDNEDIPNFFTNFKN